MSATTVRAQMQAFLAGGNITGLQRVYLSEPWFVDGGQWDLAANSGWGAIGYVWISDDSEERISLGAVAGQKRVTYQTSIVLMFQYLIPSAPTAEDAWQAPLDEIIDGVKARLRSDPKAGTGTGLDGVIFEQSQAPGDLHVVRDMPTRTAGKVVCWQRIDTTITEIITA